MNKGKIGAFIGFIFALLLIASVFATLTSITVNSPVNFQNISGTFLLNATLPSSDNATIVDFWWFDGNIWNLIGENTTPGNNFTYSWDTTGINKDPVQVKANATNGSVEVTSASVQNITIDNIAPLAENITNSSIGQWSALITFDTNEKTNASVNYGQTTSLGTIKTNNTYSYSHYVKLTNLTENKVYYYNVTACDFSGNCNQSSSTYSFTTLNQIPLIENISVSVTNETAYITWDTDELANSSVNYGTSTSLGTIALNATNVTSHAINVTGLTNGTTYYYNITSCDLVGNCNETGTYNFTTHLDDTPPQFTGGITIRDSAGNDVTSVNQDEYVNITASVGDNIQIDEIWAQLELQDGSVFNRTMNVTSGEGSLTNNSLASLYYNCTSSGVHNVTVYANDTSGNVAHTDKNSWTVYGYFTFLSNTSTGFKNFTNGQNLSILYTVINDRAVSDDYSFSFNLTSSATGASINGTAGWLISSNATSASSIASGAKAYFKIEVSVPLNATGTFYVNTRVNSSSGKSESKTLAFPQETISISLPSTVKVSNSTAYTGILYEYYNYTNTSWMKSMNVTYFSVSSEASSNITNSSFSCGLYNGTSLKKSGVVILTNSNMSSNGLSLSNASCVINVTGVTAGKYNLTINVTNDKNHKGSAYKQVIVPGEVVISAENGTLSKGVGFTLTGSAYYSEDSDYKVVKGKVKAEYDNKVCLGETLYNGAFSLSCPGFSKEGEQELNLTVTGAFNISKTKKLKMKVISNSKDTSEKISIVTSKNEIELKNQTTISITVFNNYLTSKNVSIKAIEEGATSHFNISYDSASVVIQSNSSAEFNLTLTPFNYPKPGSYNVIISADSASKEIKVTIPSFDYKNNSVNTNRFVEKKGDETIIGIEVKNELDFSVKVNITESISKKIAETTDLIEFSIEPVIIQKDPVVMWTLNLSPGQKTELTYTIKKDVASSNFEKPTILATSLTEEGSSEQVVVEESKTKKLIYIIIIFLLTGAGIFYILFKDQFFKPKQKNFLKPGLIEESKRKLLGDGKYHFKKKKEEKKQNEESREPVFNFSGVSRRDDD